MLALGALLTCGAILALAVSATLFRRPDAARWTTASWADELISVAIVAMLAIGLAQFVAGAARAYFEGPQLVDLGLLAVVLLAAVAIWRKLDLRARMRAAAVDPRAGVAAPQTLATSERQPSQPRPRAA